MAVMCACHHPALSVDSPCLIIETSYFPHMPVVYAHEILHQYNVYFLMTAIFLFHSSAFLVDHGAFIFHTDMH